MCRASATRPPHVSTNNGSQRFSIRRSGPPRQLHVLCFLPLLRQYLNHCVVTNIPNSSFTFSLILFIYFPLFIIYFFKWNRSSSHFNLPPSLSFLYLIFLSFFSFLPGTFHLPPSFPLSSRTPFQWVRHLSLSMIWSPLSNPTSEWQHPLVNFLVFICFSTCFWDTVGRLLFSWKDIRNYKSTKDDIVILKLTNHSL